MIAPTAIFAILPAALGSPVGPVTATFTADNHYAIYSGSAGVVSLVGGNETGAAGSSGGSNWSQAESFTFLPGDTIFLAVWSDNATAQGLLGQIDLGSNTWLRTGDLGWEVYRTGVPMGDGSAWPLAATISVWNASANANAAWQIPYAGPQNKPTTQPWGKIDNISPQALWTWAPAIGGGAVNPLTTAGNGAEAILFRSVISVPAPGAAALMAAAATLVLPFRRRRSR